MQAPQKPGNPNLLEIPVHNLKPGMFIAELDRPWLETPFAVQGFCVSDEADITYIGKYCTHVYVDPSHIAPAFQPTPKRRRIRDEVAFKEEFQRSQADFESATETMERVFSQLGRDGKVDILAIQETITPLIDSIFRNQEALAALVRLKDKADYFYAHSLSTAVWSAVLGRHLGLDKPTLADLALGASVMDVGMTELGDELIDAKPPLSTTQLKQLRRHVATSIRMLSRSGTVSNRVLNIVACHHERLNGEGYPRGLRGDEIPILARIVGLADSYDAMMSVRPQSGARSSFAAMQELQDAKDVLFQGSLVEHFVQTIGMFPTGAIVELNTGEVGVVVQQNPSRRLRPKIVVITDEHKQPRNQLAVIDLSKYQNGRADEATLWITNELESGAYGIQPDAYFL